MSERGEKLREAAELADEESELRERQKTLTEEIKLSWLNEQPISDHFELEKRFAVDHRLTLSDARKEIHLELKKYEIEGQDIPMMIKELKKFRRTLKGEKKIAVTKSIDNLITSYSTHLDSNIEKIYWIRKYKTALKDMSCSEEKLIKLSFIQDEKTRRDAIDSLCKYWEARIERDGMAYCSDYSKMTKQMTNSKRAFNKIVKQSVLNIGPKELIKRHVVRLVSEEQGISARQVHERLPENLLRKSSPRMISKLAKSQNITIVNGALYKMSDEIKKDIYAYTAAFIDSDGYITMDKNHNPRVGLVATGDRGKAFMIEMEKSLGCGRLHLDQKSPQNTKLINRLNFYSRADVNEVLLKCLPYFRLKKKNAEILIELLRMKKSHKKADWYKARKVELFKLMKYENHKDDTNYDFTQYEIDIGTVVKYYSNDKTSIMDELEAVLKQNPADKVMEVE